MLKSPTRKKKRILRQYRWRLIGFILCMLNFIIGWQALPQDRLMEEEGFTIIIQAWTRYNALSSILANYEQCSKRGVPIRGIHIIRPANREPNSQHGGLIPVVWDQVTKDSPLFEDIQRRFLFPFKGINTQAVLHVDDDIIPTCSGLRHGFQTWKRNRDQIVGYTPRLATRDGDDYSYKKWIFGVWSQKKYNIILTKYAFLDIRYMELYRTTVHQRVKDFIRENTNCEDISMQFLVSSMTENPPVYVAGEFTDVGAFHGISTGQNAGSTTHFDIRDECVKLLSETYGVSNLNDVPLIDSSDFAAGRWSWWVNFLGWFPNSRFEYAAF